MTDEHDIAEICSLINPKYPNLDWLDNIQLQAEIFLKRYPKRKSAALLKEAINYSKLAKQCIEACEAAGAALTAMAALQSAWHAEILEGRTMIEAGAKMVIKSDQGRKTQTRTSNEKVDKWREAAAEIRLKKPNLYKKTIAKNIEEMFRNTEWAGTAAYIERKID